MPKFLARFSKSGLTTRFCSIFFTARGAAATFTKTYIRTDLGSTPQWSHSSLTVILKGK
jgi:hypothetical protein